RVDGPVVRLLALQQRGQRHALLRRHARRRRRRHGNKIAASRAMQLVRRLSQAAQRPQQPVLVERDAANSAAAVGKRWASRGAAGRWWFGSASTRTATGPTS